jgi:CRP-like cAMP-binding protein
MVLTDKNRKIESEDLLAKVPLFSRLSKKSLKKLAAVCVPRHYPANTVMMRDGTTGLGLFLVISGSVEIFKGDGEDRVSLAIVRPGDILGEMALIDDQPRSASAVSLQPTECLLITRDGFQTLVKKDPDIAWSLVPALVERLRQQQDKILAAKSARQTEARPTDTAEKVETPTEQADAEEEPRKDDTRESGPSGPSDLPGVMRFLQIDHALAMAGVTGLDGTVKLLETFIRELVDETGLEDGDELGEMARRFPKGVLSALGSTLTEGEKLPERMIAQFRKTLKRY